MQKILTVIKQFAYRETSIADADRRGSMGSVYLTSELYWPSSLRSEISMRVGIIGYGFIGKYAVQSILDSPQMGLQLAFVHARKAEILAALPSNIQLPNLADWKKYDADLIVECAHPSVTQEYGAAFLEVADYLPLSVNALGDAKLESELLAASEKSGKRPADSARRAHRSGQPGRGRRQLGRGNDHFSQASAKHRLLRYRYRPHENHARDRRVRGSGAWHHEAVSS